MPLFDELHFYNNIYPPCEEVVEYSPDEDNWSDSDIELNSRSSSCGSNYNILESKYDSGWLSQMENTLLDDTNLTSNVAHPFDIYSIAKTGMSVDWTCSLLGKTTQSDPLPPSHISQEVSFSSDNDDNISVYSRVSRQSSIVFMEEDSFGSFTDLDEDCSGGRLYICNHSRQEMHDGSQDLLEACDGIAAAAKLGVASSQGSLQFNGAESGDLRHQDHEESISDNISRESPVYAYSTMVDPILVFDEDYFVFEELGSFDEIRNSPCSDD